MNFIRALAVESIQRSHEDFCQRCRLSPPLSHFAESTIGTGSFRRATGGDRRASSRAFAPGSQARRPGEGGSYLGDRTRLIAYRNFRSGFPAAFRFEFGASSHGDGNYRRILTRDDPGYGG